MCLFDLRLEAGPLVEVEVLPDPLRMLKDLGREGVLLLQAAKNRDFFAQNQPDQKV